MMLKADVPAAPGAESTPPAFESDPPGPIDAKGLVPKENGFRFQRVGSVWHLQFGDEKTELADTLSGLIIVARLLQKKHAAIPALQIEGHDRAAIPQIQRDAPVMGEEEKASCRQRLAEVEQAMGDVAEWKDQSEYNKLVGEKEQIIAQLTAAVGAKGDRLLDAGNESHKAAERVKKAIAAVGEKLKTRQCGMPNLAAHLKRNIKKEGQDFAYRPGEPAPDWVIST
jgi:hypothetical protein